MNFTPKPKAVPFSGFSTHREPREIRPIQLLHEEQHSWEGLSTVGHCSASAEGGMKDAGTGWKGRTKGRLFWVSRFYPSLGRFCFCGGVLVYLFMLLLVCVFKCVVSTVSVD